MEREDALNVVVLPKKESNWLKEPASKSLCTRCDLSALWILASLSGHYCDNMTKQGDVHKQKDNDLAMSMGKGQHDCKREDDKTEQTGSDKTRNMNKKTKQDLKGERLSRPCMHVIRRHAIMCSKFHNQNAKLSPGNGKLPRQAFKNLSSGLWQMLSKKSNTTALMCAPWRSRQPIKLSIEAHVLLHEAEKSDHNKQIGRESMQECTVLAPDLPRCKVNIEPCGHKGHRRAGQVTFPTSKATENTLETDHSRLVQAVTCYKQQLWDAQLERKEGECPTLVHSDMHSWREGGRA